MVGLAVVTAAGRLASWGRQLARPIGVTAVAAGVVVALLPG